MGLLCALRLLVPSGGELEVVLPVLSVMGGVVCAEKGGIDEDGRKKEVSTDAGLLIPDGSSGGGKCGGGGGETKERLLPRGLPLGV